MSASSATSAASPGTGQSVEGTTLRLTVGGRTVPATKVDNATAREFVQMLPLSVRMSDMLGREAYGAGLPRDLTDDAPRRTELRGRRARLLAAEQRARGLLQARRNPASSEVTQWVSTFAARS